MQHIKFNDFLNEDKKSARETVVVKDWMELYNLIAKEIKENGNKCDLNFIDISHLESLNQLFSSGATKHFNGDISKWDTSNITSLMQTFEGSDFNGDISKWNVSKVENMDSTFAESKFNGDISKWDVSKVKDMSAAFYASEFNGDLSKWKTKSLRYMPNIFNSSKFRGDISKWDVSNVENLSYAFADCNVDISKLGKWEIGKVHGSRTQKRGFADGNPTYKKAYENDTLPKWCGKSKSEVDAVYKKLAKTHKGSQDDSMAKYYDTHPTDF